MLTIHDCETPSDKACAKCRQTLPMEMFGKSKSAPGGIRYWCKPCNSRSAQEYAAKNKEVVSKKKREYSRKINVGRIASGFYVQYRQANRGRLIEQNKEYYRLNKTRILEYHKRYMKENPHIKTACEHRRNALKRGFVDNFTSLEWIALKEKYNYVCLCCGVPEPDITLTVDHVVPISKGGGNSIENIQPLCFSCNSSKKVKSTDYRILWDEDQ